MKIIQAAACPFPSPQGSQVYVRGMSRALARRGHEVVVVCYEHGWGEPDPEYRVIRTPHVPGYSNMRAGPDMIKPLLDVALYGRRGPVPAIATNVYHFWLQGRSSSSQGQWRHSELVLQCNENCKG